MVGRAKGSGNISDIPKAPNRQQKPNKGMVNPNMIKVQLRDTRMSSVFAGACSLALQGSEDGV